MYDELKNGETKKFRPFCISEFNVQVNMGFSMTIFGLEVTNYDGDGFINGVGHYIT